MYQEISDSVDWFAMLFKKFYVQQVDELSAEVLRNMKSVQCKVWYVKDVNAYFYEISDSESQFISCRSILG